MTGDHHLWHLDPVKAWIVRHDRSLLFAVGYVTLTIVLSVFVGYFWLLVVVGLHVLLEWLKKGYLGYRPGLHRTAWTLWDTKFDLALIFMAFTLLSYTGINAGVAGAQSVSRMGILSKQVSALSSRLAPMMARFTPVGTLTRAMGLRGVDVFFSARVLLLRKADMSRAAADELHLLAAAEQARVPVHLPWQQRLSRGAWVALIMIAVNLTAVLVCPLVTDHSYASLAQSLVQQLHPWP